MIDGPSFLIPLAHEANRLTGRKGPVFERRYEMTVVTGEEPAQVERLKYVLANGVKENGGMGCQWARLLQCP